MKKSGVEDSATIRTDAAIGNIGQSTSARLPYDRVEARITHTSLKTINHGIQGVYKLAHEASSWSRKTRVSFDSRESESATTAEPNHANPISYCSITSTLLLQLYETDLPMEFALFNDDLRFP